MLIVDCKGLACPQPVLETKKAIDKGNFPIEVTVDNEVAVENISRMLTSSNCEFSTTKAGEFYKLVISSQEGKVEEKSTRNLVWLVTAFGLGQGSEELGVALRKSWLHTLSESEAPGTIYFLNSAVKLTAGPDSPKEYLDTLISQGWKLESCGTCLDYYGIKRELHVGIITNMYSIVEGIQSADKVITI